MIVLHKFIPSRVSEVCHCSNSPGRSFQQLALEGWKRRVRESNREILTDKAADKEREKRGRGKGTGSVNIWVWRPRLTPEILLCHSPL